MSRPAGLILIRHGETEYNRLGLRCGGDLDLPMNATGRSQVIAAAERLAAAGQPCRLIVASPLLRTVETAELLRARLGGTIALNPAAAERRLGQWNGRPVAETEAALKAGTSPPGGESEEDFAARIGGLLADLELLADQDLLLVGSRGVARMLLRLRHHAVAPPLGNGEIVRL